MTKIGLQPHKFNHRVFYRLRTGRSFTRKWRSQQIFRLWLLLNEEMLSQLSEQNTTSGWQPSEHSWTQQAKFLLFSNNALPQPLRSWSRVRLITSRQVMFGSLRIHPN